MRTAVSVKIDHVHRCVSVSVGWGQPCLALDSTQSHSFHKPLASPVQGLLGQETGNLPGSLLGHGAQLPERS